MDLSIGDGEPDLDWLESKRDEMQAHRTLTMIKEFLLDRFDVLEEAWQKLEDSGSGGQKLLPEEFAAAMEEIFGFHTPEAEEAFEVLDGLHYGMAEGRVTLNALRDAIIPLEGEGPEEDDDPLGKAFAAFLQSDCVLESLSLRSCRIGRRELVPISRALMESRHLCCLNLYGNRICDRGASLIAAALESFRGLEFLGLAENRITIKGLGSLAEVLGLQRVDSEELGGNEPEVRAKVEAQAAEREARAKEPPRVDGNGRERRQRPPYANDEFEEREEVSDIGGESGVIQYFMLRRPSDIKTLDMSANPIQDAEAVEALQPLGPDGVELILRRTPAAKIILEAQKRNQKDRRGSSKRSVIQSGEHGWKLIL